MPFSAGRERTIVFNIAVQFQDLLHIFYEHFGTRLSSSIRAFALGPNLGTLLRFRSFPDYNLFALTQKSINQKLSEMAKLFKGVKRVCCCCCDVSVGSSIHLRLSLTMKLTFFTFVATQTIQAFYFETKICYFRNKIEKVVTRETTNTE